MSLENRASLTDRTRGARVVLAVLGGLWAAVTMPVVATAFGSQAYTWVFDLPVYVWARAWPADPYITYGAFAAFSFLAIGLALLPDLNRAGWGGKVMVWLLIAGAPVCVASYLSTPSSAPLHFLWGAEGLVLFLAALFGVAAAITAGRRWRLWLRILLGSTFVVAVAGTLVFGYWPHGTLVAIAVEAVVVIAAAPRDAAFGRAPVDAHEVPSAG